MDEHEYVGDEHGAGTPYGPGRLLTPRACAIAGFAFAVFGMLGQGTWSQALQTLFWGTNFAPDEVPVVLASWGFGTLLLSGIGWLLARRTTAEPEAALAWEGDLARAAVLVAVAGAVFSVLGIVGGLLHAVG